MKYTAKSYAHRRRRYRSRDDHPAPPRPLSTRDVGAFIQKMTKYRNSGEISHAQYQQLVELACGAYIAQQVERQIMAPLEKALSPERLARYLSSSH